MTLIAQAPPGVPGQAAVMARAGGENFSVASRLLPRGERADLLAVYGFARLVDELGDSLVGDRLAALDWCEAELDRAFQGQASHPLLVRLQPTLRDRRLPRGPFVRLIDANRMDQRVSEYDSWEQLRDYCSLSANPVGELVLGVFDAATPARVELSDSICTGLQLAEHCQDVAEDLAAGRVYLPREDRERFAVAIADLGAAHAGPEVRALVGFEVARARALLDGGLGLVADLRGRPRLGVAGFLAGGRAALSAIERARCDVLAGAPKAGRWTLLRELADVLARARGGSP